MPYNLQSLPKARTCFQAILTLVCFLQVSLSRGQVTVAGALGGVNGAYTQLRLAFNAINTQLQGGANIVVTITGNTVETGTAQLIQSAAPWNSFTIIPSGGAARTISGNLALPLINLNGADRVKIDGLNAGGNSLTIVNNSTSALASPFNSVRMQHLIPLSRAWLLVSRTNLTSASISSTSPRCTNGG